MYIHTSTKGGAPLYNTICMYNVQYNVCIMGPYRQAAVNRQNGNGKTRRVHNNQSSTVRLQPAEFSSRLTLDGASRRRRRSQTHACAPFV